MSLRISPLSFCPSSVVRRPLFADADGDGRFGTPARQRTTDKRTRGFTLVELLVVMVIISILLGFILNASMDAVKRAQERADPDPDHQARGRPQRPARRPDADAGPTPTPPTSSWRTSTTATTSRCPATCGHKSSPGMTISRARCPTRSTCRIPPIRDDRGIYPINFAGNAYPYGSSRPGRTTSCPWGTSRSPGVGDNNLYNTGGDRRLRRLLSGGGRHLQEPGLLAAGLRRRRQQRRRDHRRFAGRHRRKSHDPGTRQPADPDHAEQLD